LSVKYELFCILFLLTGTLYELEQDLASLFQKKNYNELLIGPLYKHPKIFELFHYLPSTSRTGGHVLNLKTSDVMRYLQKFITKQHGWSINTEINTEEFLKFIAQQLSITNVYELGIRIKSPYLPRTVSIFKN
jgi:hypothetical protein